MFSVLLTKPSHKHCFKSLLRSCSQNLGLTKRAQRALLCCSSLPLSQLHIGFALPRALGKGRFGVGGAIGGEQAPAPASGIPKADKKQGIWLGKSGGELATGCRKMRVWVGLCRGGGAGWEQPVPLLHEGASRIPCLSSVCLPPENANCCFFSTADTLYMNYFDSFFD